MTNCTIEKQSDVLQALRDDIVAKLRERAQFRKRQLQSIVREINNPNWNDCERREIIGVYTMLVEELRLMAKSIEERKTVWDLECELAEAIHDSLTIPEGG